MSIKSDINKLVLDKKVNKELGAASVRPPIKASNVVFRQEKSITGPKTDPITGAVTFDDPSTDSETTVSGGTPIKDLGSGSGTGVNTPPGASVDADDLLDGIDGPQFPDTTSDQTTNTSSPLSNITNLTNCDTGWCVNVHTDGVFPIPDGWADADTPPLVGGWVLGKKWIVGSLIGYPGSTWATKSEAVTRVHTTAVAIMADLQDGDPRPMFIEIGTDTDILYTELINVEAGNIAGVRADRVNCTPGNSFCLTSQPFETEWPVDGCYDLALKNGEFVSSQYDSDAPAESDDKSTATLCTATGRNLKIEVAANDGYMLYEVDGSGAGSGAVYVYNSDGTLRAAGDHSTQFINLNLPR